MNYEVQKVFKMNSISRIHRLAHLTRDLTVCNIIDDCRTSFTTFVIRCHKSSLLFDMTEYTFFLRLPQKNLMI